MKKIITVLCVMFFLSGCVHYPDAPFRPSQGVIYTHVKAPLSTEVKNKEILKRHGKADSTFIQIYIFGFSFGDNSLQKAIRDGFLKNASYVDYEWQSILGMFGRLTVDVYGIEQPEKN